MATYYEQYEQDCEDIREENAELLKDSTGWLREHGFPEATVRRHRSNIDRYVNHLLLEEQATPAARGCSGASSYLGFWFIRKVWASAWAIRSNAASLKRFYAFTVERGLVESADLARLKDAIRNGMPGFLRRVERYNDPSITDPAEVWVF